mmetsp:Transcript_135490/g.377350  ORF Transcript_135490/g.377350 Transcript_135490/m.377350 type:complete len:360 (-) Transcript_135490:30-1109(-)
MELLRALGESDRSVAEVITGLEVVRTLLTNIADSPGEDRYRRVRKGNMRIVPLLGREEEGLLRAAGFVDEGGGGGTGEAGYLVCQGSCAGSGSAECLQGEAQEPAAPPQLLDVLNAVQAVLAPLQEKLAEAKNESEGADALPELPGLLLCRDPPVARALDCALLDHVGQRSVEAAEAHKRRRRADEAAAVASPTGWRAVLGQLGGGFLCDGGPLEAWLDADVAHRRLAHDLVQLQEAAARWYGPGARQHCDAWRAGLLAHGADADAGAGGPPLLGTLISEELEALRQAIFEFPEREGAAPALFRDACAGGSPGVANAGGAQGISPSPLQAPPDGSGDCTVLIVCTPQNGSQAPEIVPLE